MKKISLNLKICFLASILSRFCQQSITKLFLAFFGFTRRAKFLEEEKKSVSKPDKFINFLRPFFARFKNFLSGEGLKKESSNSKSQ